MTLTMTERTSPLRVDPELLLLKEQLSETWSAGDYGRVAPELGPGTETFMARNPITAGERVLDLACGDGRLALSLARAGARVTGIDLAPAMVARASQRAAAADLDLRFEQGDVERLPFADRCFDVVLSFVGVMFAPRPWMAASELLRVCRPGGRIVLASWTAEGFFGRMLQTVERHAPSSPLMPSPLLWGQEETLRRRLGSALEQASMERYSVPLIHRFGPAEVVDHYRAHFGPTRRAFERLSPDGRSALRRDLRALWRQANQATDGGLCVESELLELRAVKA